MLSLFAVIATVAAANNAFTYPVTNVTVKAGSSMDIKWANASGSTADILLRTGDPNHLKTISTIASKIDNQGSYSWSVPSDIVSGSYALEITADGGENYSSFFTIVGGKAPSSSSAVSSSAAASSSARSSSAASGSKSASSSAAGSSAAASSAAKTTSAGSAPFVNGSTNGTSNGTASHSGSHSGTASKSSSASSTGSSSSSSSKGTTNGAASLTNVALVGAIGVGASLLL